jgi:hypothetical protein
MAIGDKNTTRSLRKRNALRKDNKTLTGIARPDNGIAAPKSLQAQYDRILP